MTASNTLNYYQEAHASFVSTDQEEDMIRDYKKVLNFTTMSMKMSANSHYKSYPFLESSDIEQIKSSLSNYTNNVEKIEEFKNSLIEDLTEFQAQIKTNYVQKLEDLQREKQFLEKQLKVLEIAKNNLIREKLSKIEWPYDSKTKEYEGKIAVLQIKIQKDEQKIEELKKMRPIANEKDILIYEMQLKEKYAAEK